MGCSAARIGWHNHTLERAKNPHDELAQLFVGGLGLSIDALEFTDQLDGQPTPGFAERIAWLPR